MAWESRGTRRYYYRARRTDGGRIVKRCFTGAEAERAAEEDARRRAEQQAEREAIAAETVSTQPARELMGHAEEMTRLIVNATLLAAGFHLHDYAWRRRRGITSDRGIEPAGGDR